MNINQDNIFSIRGIPVSCHFEFVNGVNVLFGANGIGKSTFFQFLKKHRAQIFANEKCAFMDQFPLAPIAELTGREVLNILKKDLLGFDEDLTQRLIKVFDFEKLLDSRVEHYSGGENQVFKFIILIGQNAENYFLDEPLQYLDNKNVNTLLDVLKGLENKKILVIEHRKEKIEKIEYKLISMDQVDSKIEISNA